MAQSGDKHTDLRKLRSNRRPPVSNTSMFSRIPPNYPNSVHETVDILRSLQGVLLPGVGPDPKPPRDTQSQYPQKRTRLEEYSPDHLHNIPRSVPETLKNRYIPEYSCQGSLGELPWPPPYSDLSAHKHASGYIVPSITKGTIAEVYPEYGLDYESAEGKRHS